MTADSRRTQQDIESTSDKDWFDLLAGRRPPTPGNTSEARAAQLNVALSSVYEVEQSRKVVTENINRTPGRKIRTTRRRPRRSRWIEYPAVAAAAALAGFLVGQVIDVSREASEPGWVPKGHIEGWGVPAADRSPQVHVGLIELNSEFVNREFLREFLVGEGVLSGQVSQPPDGVALVTFLIPTDQSDTLREAMSVWHVNGEAGDVVVLMLVGGAVD